MRRRAQATKGVSRKKKTKIFVKDARELFDELKVFRQKNEKADNARSKLLEKAETLSNKVDDVEKQMKKNETRMLLAGADVSARSSPRVEVAEERRRRALTSRDALLVEEQILEYELLVKGLQRSNPVERARADDALRSASIANAQCAAVGREVIEDLRGAIERAGRGRIAAELLPGGTASEVVRELRKTRASLQDEVLQIAERIESMRDRVHCLRRDRARIDAAKNRLEKDKADIMSLRMGS